MKRKSWDRDFGNVEKDDMVKMHFSNILFSIKDNAVKCIFQIFYFP